LPVAGSKVGQNKNVNCNLSVVTRAREHISAIIAIIALEPVKRLVHLALMHIGASCSPLKRKMVAGLVDLDLI
jgi:hypothetical protein